MKPINVCDPKIIVQFITERNDQIKKTKAFTKNNDISCIQEKDPVTTPTMPFDEVKEKFEEYFETLNNKIEPLESLSNAVIHKVGSGNLKYSYNFAKLIEEIKNHQAQVRKDNNAIKKYLREKIEDMTKNLSDPQKTTYFKEEAIPEIYTKIFNIVDLIQRFKIDAGDFTIKYDITSIVTEFNKLKAEFKTDARSLGMSEPEITAIFGA